jgi:hypothetical protein
MSAHPLLRHLPSNRAEAEYEDLEALRRSGRVTLQFDSEGNARYLPSSNGPIMRRSTKRRLFKEGSK